MDRFANILSVEFDGVALGLPLSLRLGRRAQTSPAGQDSHAFATSIQLHPPLLSAELRLRDLSAVDNLELGRCGQLVIRLGRAAAAPAPARELVMDRAVLTGVEIAAEQGQMACAILQFAAESVDGLASPLTAEDEQ